MCPPPVMPPLALPSDGEVVRDLRCKTVRPYPFDVDGVRTGGQRGEQEPVPVRDMRRERPAGEPKDGTRREGETEDGRLDPVVTQMPERGCRRY